MQKLAELLVILSPIMKSGVEIKPETCNDDKGILDANLGIVLPAMEYEKLRFKRERIMFRRQSRAPVRRTGCRGRR